MRVAAADGAAGTSFEGDEDGAAPAFDDADAKSIFFGGGDGGGDGIRFDGGVAEGGEEFAAEAERLEDLAEAEVDAGGYVAGGFCNYFGC